MFGKQWGSLLFAHNLHEAVRFFFDDQGIDLTQDEFPTSRTGPGWCMYEGVDVAVLEVEDGYNATECFNLYKTEYCVE